MERQKRHLQVPIRVTALIDQGIAEVVKALNEIDGVITFSSCEGRHGEEYAHVYFDYPQVSPRHWLKSARLAHALARCLARAKIYDSVVSLEWSEDKERPFIALEFESDNSQRIATALIDHKSEFSDGI